MNNIFFKESGCRPRALILLAAFVLAAFLLWFIFENRRVVAQSAEDPTTAAPSTAKMDARPVIPNPSESGSRPLEIQLPFVGTITGARWIKGVAYREDANPSNPPVDMLVDEQGQMLAARWGDDAYASVPGDAAYRNLFTGQHLTPDGQSSIPKSVRLLPIPFPNHNTEQALLGATQGGPGPIKFQTWIPLCVEFEDDPTLYAAMFTIFTDGLLAESALNCVNGARLEEEGEIPTRYRPPVIPGASRYATQAYISTAPIRGLPDPYQEYAPISFGGARVNEAWAGFSPWRDEQIDPDYGDRRVNELWTPHDRAIYQQGAFLSLRRNGEGKLYTPVNKESEARYEARLAREAAEKAAKEKR